MYIPIVVRTTNGRPGALGGSHSRPQGGSFSAWTSPIKGICGRPRCQGIEADRLAGNEIGIVAPRADNLVKQPHAERGVGSRPRLEPEVGARSFVGARGIMTTPTNVTLDVVGRFVAFCAVQGMVFTILPRVFPGA